MKRVIWVSVIVLAVTIAILSFASDSAPDLPAGSVADLVVIDKSARSLTLFRESQSLKTYQVSLGGSPVGHKRQEGDGRTPEGVYTIDFHKRDSAFHRGLHISYPSAADIRSAKARRVSPGGDIMIHGLPNGFGVVGSLHRRSDWTAGCIAVTNNEIEELWRAVPDGTPVKITP